MAISMSLSWHELWSSGLKWRNFTIVDDDQYIDYQIDPNHMRISTFESMKSESSLTNENLKCTKNIIDSQLISLVHLAYFLILFIIYAALLFLSVLVWLRLKNVNICIDWFEADDFQADTLEIIQQGFLILASLHI